MEEQVIGTSYENEKSRFLAKTYLWMALGLLISGVTACLGAYCYPVAKFLFSSVNGTPVVMISLIVAELILVILFSAKLRTFSVGATITTFVLYSAINGFTMSSIFMIYSIQSIVYSFAASSVMFGVMAIFGLTTKKNLNTFGRYLMMALIGTLVVCLLNMIISAIVGSPLRMVDFLVNIVIVVIFTGMTAYDSQRILVAAEHSDESDDFKKLAVYGAFQLYLDFINMFLRILRIFGRRN